MRIVTGALEHETSTFTTVATPLESYSERFGFLRGQEVLDTMQGTNTPLGGFIEGATTHGFELIPTICVEPHPSGPTDRAVFDHVLGELLEGIQAALPVDGVLLQLHGSMVAEGINDCEGHILQEVRNLVGDVPIIAQLDIHSNVSKQMVEVADVLIGRETYPEVDMAARGRECADVLMRMLKEGLKPTMALHQIPMMWGMNQLTAHSPMREAIAELHRIETQPGVICGSIATCFPLSDVPDMGASVYIVTNDDLELAQSYADELGHWIYERRADWHFHMPSTEEILKNIPNNQQYPIIFADRNDNTGGGSPGDSTGMLHTFIQKNLEPACILYMVDPEATRLCHAAGTGKKLELNVGAKSNPLQGQPVTMQVEVVALSDGDFTYDGPMYQGLKGKMGLSAHIKQENLHVLLVSEREQPFDTAFARSLGLEPGEMRFIGVKSAAHFRAAFEPWAGAIYVVDEPSVHSPKTVNAHYKNLGRKLYPLDDDL